MAGKSRKERNWRVCRVPVGPGASSEKEILFTGTAARCTEYYEMLREKAGDGMALVVVDGFDRPVYACS